MFTKGTMDFKKIETMFSQLQEQFDMLAESVKQHRDTPTGIEVCTNSVNSLLANE